MSVRQRPADKVVHLFTQADRARELASESGSELVADLLEMHAQLCERNAQRRKKGQDQAGPKKDLGYAKRP